MTLLHQLPPGISLTHKVTTEIMSEKKEAEAINNLSHEEKDLIKKNFDDYMMYIWMHLGDTRFNRSGYRKATDILSNKIFNNSDRSKHAN